ncbi:serine/threonine-protein phosphatase 4 regulatory subunit 3B-like isoform X2 [Phoenix dactylifera]|uniref:Serine/threonine-protein phosphatase 4 regulatory subunit 3B-like isoform X2 n=1 Tax=Phoenix dactylifera TaxID=42345 RepID=A0A8B8JBU0_PHODC|nr:serine/threonine-protein phosphatase 4 regulatory subunit 3B-like isoform X2 [Phoenix dactylifera]
MAAHGKVSNSPNSLQRVKVYRLNDDGKWDDQGTGHVSVDYLERSEDLGLIVIDEEDNETLLVHRISSDDIYRRQEDTIISWREPEPATELALSFQEAMGCSYIWDHICGVRRNLHFSSLGNLEIGPRPAMESLKATSALQSNDETFRAVNSELRELPSVELSTLPLMLKFGIYALSPLLFFSQLTVLECGMTDQMRVAELILQDQEFFPKLMDLFRMCEDLENMDGLHMIFRLVKGIILLNNTQIFDRIFGDELIFDIIGSLEYDPDVPQVVQHRAFLKEHVVFKEAIPIKDSTVLSKIHQTYRVGYVKDVILPRVLDEATIASFNSIIHANNAAVISLLKDDASFIQELFARMRSTSTSAESKRELVLFLHEFCSLSKSLQMVQQLRLFRDLAGEGIFDIITDVLQSQDKKLVSAGADILILFLNQDPNILRSYVIQQGGDSLLGLLVKGMITDFGEDMHCQFLEIIRILMDSYTMSGSQRDTIIEIFYEKHLNQLIDVIASSCPPKGCSRTMIKSSGFGSRVETHAAIKPEILSNICELLCFCVIHDLYRINFLMNNAMEKVLFLTRRREKYLVVAAVRFMRTIISRNDEHLLRNVVKNNLLKPVIDAFIENGNRYNMLHSGVLELLEYIRKENLKSLIIYIVDSFWNQLQMFEHLGSIQAFKLKYEQSMENCDTKNGATMVDPRKRIDERALEKEEEEYFNEDSDEEDSATQLPNIRSQNSRTSLPNGTKVSYSSLGPGSGGLVDYEDDDDDDDYNPPPRKSESSTESDEPMAFTETKRKSPATADGKEEVHELTKKQKLDQHVNGCKIASGVAGRASKKEPSPPAASHTTDANGDLDEHDTGIETAGSQSYIHLRDAVDTRQAGGDDRPSIPISNSLPENVLNGKNVTDSEPSLVR